ncbi:MAG: hypothetical protein ACFFDI_22730 [Promethearchaeota archaeon]
MKNQYFGDTRDLFKYDLVLELLTKLSELKQFTFIPMLTENEKSSHGEKTNYELAKAGNKRKRLIEFLTECLENGRRDIREIEPFFKEYKFEREVKIILYEKESFFSNINRLEYFQSIRKELLEDSLILIDPDIGLAVKSIQGREEKYVKYQEIKSLEEKMNKNSIIMIFQYIPRVKREPYFLKISRALNRNISRDFPVFYISDNQIVFFLLIKDLNIEEKLVRALYDYSEKYNLAMGKYCK